MGKPDPNLLKRRDGRSQKSQGLIKQLIFGCSRQNVPDFSRVFPTKMKELVDKGIFTENGRDDRGKLTYKITPLGHKLLAQLETRNAPAP
jgi:predicted transcriptional regulator